MYKIDSGVVLPPKANYKGISETMRKLKVGDSFAAPTSNSNAFSTAKRLGIRVTTRKESNGYVRIFRIE